MTDQANNVDLRRLRYFVMLAEELNYARAAQRLRIAGPSLSQQIKTLERELKVQLFERDRRSVKLTPIGAALLPHVRKLIVQADELRRWAGDLAHERSLRLGLVRGFPADSIGQLSDMAHVSVDSWVMPSHIQARRVAVGALDLAICHLDRNELKALGLAAHLIWIEHLHAICVSSDTSPVNAKDTAVLIEADTSSWRTWNHYAEEFANASNALPVGIEDGGIAGSMFFDHVRRLRRPLLNAPEGRTDPLAHDMV